MALTLQQKIDLIYKLNFNQNSHRLHHNILSLLIGGAVAAAAVFIDDEFSGTTYQDDNLIGIDPEKLLVAVEGLVLTPGEEEGDDYVLNSDTGTITFALEYDNADITGLGYA